MPIKRNNEGNDDDGHSDYKQERIKDFNNYEVNKYMQSDIKPISMPRMQISKRAEDQDPGQSSQRANAEAVLIKNLVKQYFDIVRKTMNDMVPKTIMAFLVNKAKNQVQKELVQAFYQDGSNYSQLLLEDQETI